MTLAMDASIPSGPTQCATKAGSANVSSVGTGSVWRPADVWVIVILAEWTLL